MKIGKSSAFSLLLSTTLSLFLLCTVARAQLGDTGTIVGTVHDPSGAVIPSAKVTLTNTGMNVAQTTSTDSSGQFVLTAVKVGTYSLQVEARGFKTYLQTGITVNVNSRLEQDVNLQLGEASEKVNVTANAPLLETQSADVGHVIGTQPVEDLPLNGRRYDDLTLLVAGAVPAVKNEQARGEGVFNINGNYDLQNDFILDGVDNNSFSTNLQEQSTQAVQPPVDTLSEFKIQTRTYDAEFGRNAGGIINATIRSGTNAWHGNAYEFLRNKSLDAADFFINRAGLKKPFFAQNQFGATGGGPIRKNTIFVFGGYEGTRSRKGSTITGSVPTPLMRQGNFSEFATPPQSPTLAGLSQFSNCINNAVLDPSCVDPVAAKVFALYPLPNTNRGQEGVPGGFVGNNFTSSPIVRRDSDSFVARGDEKFREKDTFFQHFAFFQLRQFRPGIFAEINPIADGANDTTLGKNNDLGVNAGFGWTHIFNPSVVNDFRAGYNRIASHSLQAPFGQIVNDQFGIKGVPGFSGVAGGLPEFDVTGFANLGSPRWLPQNQISYNWQFRDALTYIRGSHILKFGGEFLRTADNFLDICCNRGAFGFSGQYTGQGVTDFLLGLPTFANLASLTVVHQYQNGYSFYVQDNWRATPKLSLNLGIRYEYVTPTIERKNQITNFNPDLRGGQGALFTVPRKIAIPLERRTTISPDRNNWAPRFGFAYRFNDKLVFRGGAGIFYQEYDRRGSESNLSLNPPFLADVRDNFSPSQPPGIFLQNGFPSNFLAPPDINNLDQVSQLFLRTINQNLRSGVIQQYSAGAEYSVTSNLVVEVAGVANLGHKLWRLENLNQKILTTPGQASGDIPFPDFRLNRAVAPVDTLPTTIEFLDSSGNSNYYGLQVTATQRFSKGLTFLASYTFSKTLADFATNLAANSGAFSLGRASVPQDSHNLRGDRGLAPFDVPNRFTASGSYELPIGPGHRFASSGLLGKLAESWSLHSIITASGGQPVQINAPFDTSETGEFRGEFRADCGSRQAVDRTVDHDFDTSAFTIPQRFHFGNCSVSPGVRTRGFVNVDFSVFKDVHITENKYLQIRSEFFNLLNHTQLGAPGLVVGTPSFGTITTLTNDPREIQFALKFFF